MKIYNKNKLNKIKEKIIKFAAFASLVATIGPLAATYVFAGDEVGETVETLTEAATAEKDERMSKAQSLILLAICIVIVVLLARRSKMNNKS